MTDFSENPDDTPGTVDIRGFWERFATAFAQPLMANGLLSGFVTNSNVTGAYAETWVREIVRSSLPHLRISTGAIIRTSDSRPGTDLRQVPQIDIIVWDPTELPALFEKNDFALVHTQAARAIIEVKRSMPSDVPGLRGQLRAQQQRLLSDFRRNVLCVIVTHAAPLLTIPPVPDWPARKKASDAPELTRLLVTGSLEPDPDGVHGLLSFLHYVARHAQPPRTAF